MAAIIRSSVVAPASRRLRRGADSAVAPSSAPVQLPVPPGDVVAVGTDALPALSGDAAQLAAEWALLRERQAEQQRAEALFSTRDEHLAERDRQLQAARLELAEGTAQAMAHAEQRGLALAREQAEREVAEQVAAHGERVSAIVAALNQSRRRALDEHEDMLVEIAFAAVCRMLGATAATRGAVEAMVRSLTDAEREPAQVRVLLHPHDVGLLGQGSGGLDQRLVLQADDAIELGGCRIEGPRGTLDARLELQVQQLRATLLSVRGAPDKNEVPV